MRSTAEHRIGDYRIETSEEPLSPTGVSLDGSLVRTYGSTLRLAVFDGVTPLAATPRTIGVDGATYGLAILRAALLSPAAIEDCVTEANRALHQPGLMVGAQAQTTFVAADIAADGSLRVVRGCDCEAYVRRRDGHWENLFPAPAHRPAAKWASQAEEEELVWGDPEAWESHPVGRYAEARLEQVSLGSDDWTELLLTTDGLGLRERGGFVEPATVLAEICPGEHPAPERYVHGDLTILRVRRPARPNDVAAVLATFAQEANQLSLTALLAMAEAGRGDQAAKRAYNAFLRQGATPRAFIDYADRLRQDELDFDVLTGGRGAHITRPLLHMAAGICLAEREPLSAAALARAYWVGRTARPEQPVSSRKVRH